MKNKMKPARGGYPSWLGDRAVKVPPTLPHAKILKAVSLIQVWVSDHNHQLLQFYWNKTSFLDVKTFLHPGSGNSHTEGANSGHAWVKKNMGDQGLWLLEMSNQGVEVPSKAWCAWLWTHWFFPSRCALLACKESTGTPPTPLSGYVHQSLFTEHGHGVTHRRVKVSLVGKELPWADIWAVLHFYHSFLLYDTEKNNFQEKHVYFILF